MEIIIAYTTVTRSDGLTKVILEGTVEGSRRRGRPKKSWIDNIAPSLRLKPWPTTGRSGENWRGSPSWRAPTALRGAKGPRQGKANECQFFSSHTMDELIKKVVPGVPDTESRIIEWIGIQRNRTQLKYVHKWSRALEYKHSVHSGSK